MRPKSTTSRTLSFVALLVWAIGVLTMEAVATVGTVLLMIAALVIIVREGVPPVRDMLQRWWPLALFIAWALIVPLLAGHKPEGAGLGRLSDWLALPAAAVVFPRLTEGQRRALGWTAALLFLASCLVAFLQYERWWPTLEAMQPFAWTKLPFGRAYEQIPGSEDHFYGVGLAFHRLKFANVGGLAIIAAFAVALKTTGRDRIIAALVIIVGMATIWIATQARSASAAIIAGLLVMALMALTRARDRLIAVGAIALLVAIAIVGSAGMRRRIVTSFDSSGNGERALIWTTAVGAVRSAPLTGVGLGRYKIADYIRHDAPWDVRWHQGKGHNQFLTFAAELGIPGALIFAWLLVWLFRSFRGEGALLGRGAMAFFVVLSCVHDPLFHATVSMACVVVFGMAKGLGRTT